MTGLLVRFCCSMVVLATVLSLPCCAIAQQDDHGPLPQSASGDAAAQDADPSLEGEAQPAGDDDPQSDRPSQATAQPQPDQPPRQAPQATQFVPREDRFADPVAPQTGRPVAGQGPTAGQPPTTSQQRGPGPREGSGLAQPAPATGGGDNGAATAAGGEALAPTEGELVFNFAGADWRMVLGWLAEQADLSLQVDRYPAGSVNYIDSTRTYNLSEAMDVLNQLLMDRGFALVRRGRLLMLIDLEADNARALISELAEQVTPDQLDRRADSDIVRCVFPLGGLSTEAARLEITQLIGPAGRAIVLDSSRQVVVTETVGRLKTIRALLANATTTSSEVTEIVLQHRVADELLELARPLIGLEAGANSNDKIRIATGLYGDRIYATGDASMRALLKGIIERADTPLQIASVDGSTEQSIPRLETYAISTATSATVIDVLQTLLAGVPDTRIAADPQTGGIIALARPETHQLIQQTIDKLEGRGSAFEIIQLRRLEPSQALLTINKFFGTSEAGRKDAPTVDGDPVTGRLWVRGTPEQIELVKSLIERLEGAGAAGPMGDRFRVLPYTGRTAEETVEQLQNVWDVMGRKNRIRMVAPSSGGSASNSRSTGDAFPQRRVGGLAPSSPRGNANQRTLNPVQTPASIPDSDHDQRFEQDALPPDAARNPMPSTGLAAGEPTTLVSERRVLVSEAAAQDRSPFVTQNSTGAAEPAAQSSQPAEPDGSGDIVITMTPGGMIVASDDPIALSDFEQMMRTLNDQTSLSSAQPTVFWLKYAKAPEAADLVTRILGGGDSAGGGGGGGGLASSMLGELGGGMLGGLLGLGGGSGEAGSGPILTTTGTVSIVADGRLNALIVQANAVDMRTIEMILEVVDREESPEDVRTTSKPQLIPVIYQNASDVATIVKAVYAERSAEQGGGRQQQQMSPQDLLNAIRGGGGGGRGGRGGGGGSEQATKPAPVSIAVDTRSNSLIVTAPPQDVEDIRELVEAIDAGGMQSEETVEIVTLNGNVRPDVVQQALDSVLGSRARSATTASTTTPTAGGTTTAGGTAPSSSDVQRREFFQQMLQQRGGFGGGPPGGFGGGGFGGGGFGGPPGGFGGFGGRGGTTGGGGTTGRGGAPTGGGGAPTGRGTRGGR